MKSFLVPAVPDPKSSFPGLFEIHQGDFQVSWGPALCSQLLSVLLCVMYALTDVLSQCLQAWVLLAKWAVHRRGPVGAGRHCGSFGSQASPMGRPFGAPLSFPSGSCLHTWESSRAAQAWHTAGCAPGSGPTQPLFSRLHSRRAGSQTPRIWHPLAQLRTPVPPTTCWSHTCLRWISTCPSCPGHGAAQASGRT